MTEQEYTNLLRDPVRFLNNPHICARIKNNHGGHKLWIDIGYSSRADSDPAGYYPGNRQAPANKPVIYKYHRREVYGPVTNSAINLIYQESEAMVIPAYIGYVR